MSNDKKTFSNIDLSPTNNESLEQIILLKRKLIKNIEAILELETRQLEELEQLLVGGNDQESLLLKSAFPKPLGFTKMTWKDKILHIIEKAERPIPSREIAPILLVWEPNLNEKNDLRKIVSNFLSRLVKDGTVTKDKRKGQAASLYSIRSSS